MEQLGILTSFMTVLIRKPFCQSLFTR